MLYAIDVTCYMYGAICYTLYVIRYMINMLYDNVTDCTLLIQKLLQKGVKNHPFSLPKTVRFRSQNGPFSIPKGGSKRESLGGQQGGT